ncbi:similar to EMBRYO DEFECTIVE 3147 [Actinidia rufa]|uniref:Similar to EMBRYO DEFECTIVE 3147 n=1 Tax=Actinidia rufa TaxID=165716 RepID=A0A7J0GGG3_9ERIC|nr:similar to EMBRYO DEFECTIVE 3147 [Actinidia rufa]
MTDVVGNHQEGLKESYDQALQSDDVKAIVVADLPCMDFHTRAHFDLHELQLGIIHGVGDGNSMPTFAQARKQALNPEHPLTVVTSDPANKKSLKYDQVFIYDFLSHQLTYSCLMAKGRSTSIFCFTRSSSSLAANFTSLAEVEVLRARDGGQLIIDSVDVLRLGEYTALAFAGAFSFEDELKLVKLRGEAMQSAMATILGLDSDKSPTVVCVTQLTKKLMKLIKFRSQNILCPGNYAVSGDVKGVEAVEAKAKSFKARLTVRLAVAGTFHTSFMEPAVSRLEADLAATEIRILRIPVISNVDAQPHADPITIKKILAQQISKLDAALAATEIRIPRIPVISNVDAQPHADPDTIKKILAQQDNALIFLRAIANLSIGVASASHGYFFEDGLKLVKLKGEAMQGWTLIKVQQLCNAANEEVDEANKVQIANFVCPGNYAVSGDVKGVEAVEAKAKSFKARMTVRLAVAGTFHTSFMEPAVSRLEAALAATEIRIPRIPVISNVDAQPHADPDTIKKILAQQISKCCPLKS